MGAGAWRDAAASAPDHRPGWDRGNGQGVTGAIRRALDATIAQDQQRVKTKLTLPVLAIGGVQSLGTGPGDTMNNAADNVQTLVIPTGHWLMEQAPDQMLAALTAFLAPYKAAHNAAVH